ncbi:SLAM family member 9-like [Mixophyes fleayi]|uniref:SLAM family member 9-like n=1 Tax=Mixophyes fleayi TaxID=3061075 RepID=UPI003F4DFCC5
MLNKTPERIFTMLSVFFLVSAREDSPRQVIGLLNQSVRLSNYLDLQLPIEDTMWQFTTEERTVKVAEFENENLKTYFPQFTNRLQIFNNGATLVITHLGMEDSGEYTAFITLINKQLYRPSFILKVYEPVPDPTIRIEEEKRTGDWCNMSLHCSVPTNTSVLSYTWKYRHRDTEYQPYNNTGSIIQMSLQPESWDMEFLCVVHNPADQKNVSLRVRAAPGSSTSPGRSGLPGCSIYLRSALTAIYLLLSILFIHLSHCY